MTNVEESLPGFLTERPLIGPKEQRLFAIEDTHERADRLQELLVPKLKYLLDEACDLLREVYGSDVLSVCREPTTPAHRHDGKKTMSYELASAGLAVKGQVWYFSQRFECTSDGLYVKLFGLRGLEGNAIVKVLKENSRDAVRLLEHDEYELYSSAVENIDETERLDFAEFISRLRLVAETEWEDTAIYGPRVELPIADIEAASPAIYDFVALFPLFRAAAAVLQGEDDRFPYYAERFWNWRVRREEKQGDESPVAADESSIHQADPSVVPEDFESAYEGAYKIAMRRHRLREKRLRRRKIQEVLLAERGRLRCEVSGCGFDFFEVYGELGRYFAHVHHKNPLSDRTLPELTRLSDLAIVCANCHAMIHRGGQCRALEDLILSHKRTE